MGQHLWKKKKIKKNNTAVTWQIYIDTNVWIDEAVTLSFIQIKIKFVCDIIYSNSTF